MFEVTLNVEHKPLGIPYSRPESDKGSYGFVDLRKKPDQIKLIPELVDWPELRETVIALNSTTGLFKTLGCAEFSYLNEKSPEQSRLISYIEFCFEQLDLRCNKFKYYEIFHKFTEFVYDKRLPDELLIKFELRNTLYYEENISGWCLSYWVLGLGKEKQESRKVPNIGYDLLRQFIRTQIQTIKD